MTERSWTRLIANSLKVVGIILFVGILMYPMMKEDEGRDQVVLVCGNFIIDYLIRVVMLKTNT